MVDFHHKIFDFMIKSSIYSRFHDKIFDFIMKLSEIMIIHHRLIDDDASSSIKNR